MLVATSLVFGGCKKKDDPDTVEEVSSPGAIFVTVEMNGQVVPDAILTTNPETEEVTTDETGSALLEGIEPGIYQVCAVKEGVGIGSGAVQVSSNDISSTTIQLVYGQASSPMVNIVNFNAFIVGIGEPVQVLAIASDNDGEASELSVEWSTDIDGPISAQGVDENGFAVMEHAFESSGTRLLTVTVTDADGNSASDTTDIQVLDVESVVLEPVLLDGNGFVLNWSAATVSDFAFYRVYRQDVSDFNVIGVVNEISTTTFFDDDIAQGANYFYRIGAVFQGGNEVLSNTVSTSYDGSLIDVGTDLDLLLHDPDAPMIYGLDTENNSLVFINTEQQVVINTIYVGPTPTDMDFSMDNQKLYISNFGSETISVVDISSQTLESTNYVDIGTGSYGGNPYTLGVLANDRLAFASEDQHNDIKLVDINTWQNIFVVTDIGSSVYYPHIVSSPDGMSVFAGEEGSSNSQLKRYDVIGDELVFQDESSSSGWYPPNQVCISADGTYVFHQGNKYLANNLTTVVGSFEEIVYATNSDGSRVLGHGHLYNATTFSSLGPLPFETQVSVFSSNDQKAYLFNPDDLRLYAINVE